MDIETFQNLTTAEAARLVRADGSKVCVLPLNGTRRWALLEHPPEQGADFSSAYLDAIIERHVEICKLFFDHGVDTLLAPSMGPDILERGDEYMRMSAEGFASLATHPAYLELYEQYGVRVRFYGDYQRYLGPTRYAYLYEQFEAVEARTSVHDRRRLFFGLFAHDAAESVAEIGIQFYEQNGRPPSKAEIVQAYYGEQVGPVDLFIGFDKFSAFDMPLVATGNEALYFTVSPSPYLSKRQLRAILYDYLYTRRGEPELEEMDAADLALMRDFYQANLEQTFGVGIRHKGVWYPAPQLRVPSDFAAAVHGNGNRGG
jgi:tuberculosinol/isotuberculosinol synthase